MSAILISVLAVVPHCVGEREAGAHLLFFHLPFAMQSIVDYEIDLDEDDEGLRQISKDNIIPACAKRPIFPLLLCSPTLASAALLLLLLLLLLFDGSTLLAFS